MTKPRVCAAFFGGGLALVALSCGILYGSADAWRLFLGLVPPLIAFIWWMVDRAALERRIRRLEARSEIADERRVTVQVNLTEVEHRLREMAGRVGDVETISSHINEVQRKSAAFKATNGPGHIPLGCVDESIIIHLPVNRQ
jgi:hypothetical protein